MKNTGLKMMAIMLLVIAFSCQKDEVETSISSEKVQSFINQNDLTVLDEEASSQLSFESLEEAQLFINDFKEASRSTPNPLYKERNLPERSKFDNLATRTATISQDVEHIVLYNSFFIFGANLEADVSYSYCTGNGDIVNDPSTINITSYLTGLSVGLTWVPTEEIAFLATPLNKIDYIVTGRLVLGFEIEGITLGIPVTVRFEGFFGNPQGAGDGSGDCDGSSDNGGNDDNDGSNDDTGNDGGNDDGGFYHETHPGGCPPGHELH